MLKSQEIQVQMMEHDYTIIIMYAHTCVVNKNTKILFLFQLAMLILNSYINFIVNYLQYCRDKDKN